MRMLHAKRAFSLLEVLVSSALLVSGIVAILFFFPSNLRQNQRVVDISTAAYIAQMKAEEIRRDDTVNGDLIQAVQNLTSATAAVPFALDDRFAYRLVGISMLDPDDEDPNPPPLDPDPRDEEGVARVIVQYNRTFRESEDILYELRFDF